MNAIILSAGSATRIGNLTKELPKGLLETNGQTIIERQIEIYRRNGIENIILIVGPHSDKYHIKDVTYVEDYEHENHDVLGSLMTSSKYMNEGFIMSYSDIVFEEEVIRDIISFQGDFGIAVDLAWEEKYLNRTEHPKEQADNVLIENEIIIKIKKNIVDYKKFQLRGEFIGLMKLSENGAKIFVKKYNQMLEFHKGEFQDAPSLEKAYLTDLIQELIDSGIEVLPIFIDGKWSEIDTLQDLEKAKKLFSN